MCNFGMPKGFCQVDCDNHPRLKMPMAFGRPNAAGFIQASIYILHNRHHTQTVRGLPH